MKYKRGRYALRSFEVEGLGQSDTSFHDAPRATRRSNKKSGLVRFLRRLGSEMALTLDIWTFNVEQHSLVDKIHTSSVFGPRNAIESIRKDRSFTLL